MWCDRRVFKSLFTKWKHPKSMASSCVRHSWVNGFQDDQKYLLHLVSSMGNNILVFVSTPSRFVRWAFSCLIFQALFIQTFYFSSFIRHLDLWSPHMKAWNSGGGAKSFIDSDSFPDCHHHQSRIAEGGKKKIKRSDEKQKRYETLWNCHLAIQQTVKYRWVTS